mmetsp:Transcript_12668/g.21775  ORF Transcript_12668/g.21775 Transcript_12668/m.21775 type:complete len:98 (+) Transcript_12668:512-805(+)
MAHCSMSQHAVVVGGVTTTQLSLAPAGAIGWHPHPGSTSLNANAAMATLPTPFKAVTPSVNGCQGRPGRILQDASSAQQICKTRMAQRLEKFSHEHP